MNRNEFWKEWWAMNEMCDLLWASHSKRTFDFVFWNSIHPSLLIKQTVWLQIKIMSSSNIMNGYVKNYMKKVDLDHVQQTNRDNNVHQHIKENSMKGRYISKMELMPLLLGETAMIPEKMHHNRSLSRAELYIILSRVGRIP